MALLLDLACHHQKCAHFLCVCVYICVYVYLFVGSLGGKRQNESEIHM